MTQPTEEDLCVNLVLGFRIGKWLAALDDFRNWLRPGLTPRERDENGRLVRMMAGSGEIGISDGAIEAEQLFDPERA